MQLTFITYVFHIFKPDSSLKWILTPRISTYHPPMVSHRHAQGGGIPESLTVPALQLRSSKVTTLYFYFKSLLQMVLFVLWIA